MRDGRLYLVRNGGIVSCLDVDSGGHGAVAVVAAGDTPNVLARNDLGEPIYATPAVSPEGVLYVRTTSARYAFR